MQRLLLTLTFFTGLTDRAFAGAPADARIRPQQEESTLIESWQQADNLVRAGKLDDAFQILRAAVDAASEFPPDLRLAGALNDLGSICHRLGRLRQARRCFEESISIYEAGKPQPGLAIVLTNLAFLHMVQRRLTEAEKFYRRAAEAIQREKGRDSVKAAEVCNRLAELKVRGGMYEDAEEYASRALDILQNHAGQSLERGIALSILGTVRRNRGRNSEGNALIRRAIDEWARFPGRSHPTYISGIAGLAALTWEAEPAEAEPLFREALTFYQSSRGMSRPEASRVLAEYSRFLRAHGRKREAEAVERQLPATRERAIDPRVHTIDVSELHAHRPK